LANGRTRRKSPGKNKELLVYIPCCLCHTNVLQIH
jgi:hypothetical protein